MHRYNSARHRAAPPVLVVVRVAVAVAARIAAVGAYAVEVFAPLVSRRPILAFARLALGLDFVEVEAKSR